MTNLLVVGCSKKTDPLDRILYLRRSVVESNGCSFTVKVTADYVDAIYTFTMNCMTDQNGDLTFQIVEPEPISGISGRIGEDYSDLTFDDHILAFPRFAEESVTPICAPWVFLKTLRSGYIIASTTDNEQTQVMISDSYDDEALELVILLDEHGLPDYAEIVSDGRRILTLEIDQFVIL